MLMPSPKLTTPDHYVAADAPLRWRKSPACTDWRAETTHLKELSYEEI